MATVVLALLAGVRPAAATQHLIGPGRNWESLDGRVRPGDHIILLPGNHRPARFAKLRGTEQRPIVIRALDPDRPTVITADRYGLRLVCPEHVVVQDIAIVGATISGIMITDEDPRNRKPSPTGNVTIRDVTIGQVGPRGKRHGIEALGVERLQIENCSFEGWGGSGIEIVRSTDVSVEECTFRGLEDYSQECGVQVRAGSSRIRIQKCRFQGAGDVAVRLGRKSRLDDFSTPVAEDAPPGSVFEAMNVEIRNCLVLDALYGIQMTNVQDIVLRGNSLIEPELGLITALDEQDDKRFVKLGTVSLSNNLLVWSNSDMFKLIELDGDLDTSGIRLDQNLWWSSEPVDRRRTLVQAFPGESVFPQVVDVDPQLNEQFEPTTRGTELFGTRAP